MRGLFSLPIEKIGNQKELRASLAQRHFQRQTKTTLSPDLEATNEPIMSPASLRAKRLQILPLRKKKSVSLGMENSPETFTSISSK
jgi:hypothetical protein